MTALVVTLLLLPPPPADAPPRPPPTWTAAESLSRKLAAIERQVRSGQPVPPQTVLVSEAELNSYLNLSLASSGQMPPGLADVDVRLERERIAAKATVDLDRLPVKPQDSSPWNPLNLLGGRVPVELTGRLTSADGFGTFEPEQIRLATVPLPAAMLAQLVAGATRSKSNPQGFDMLSPFRLPYAAKRVRLQPGKAFLDF